MSHEICGNAELNMQNTSIVSVRGGFHLASNLRQTLTLKDCAGMKQTLMQIKFLIPKSFTRASSSSSLAQPLENCLAVCQSI